MEGALPRTSTKTSGEGCHHRFFAIHTETLISKDYEPPSKPSTKSDRRENLNSRNDKTYLLSNFRNLKPEIGYMPYILAALLAICPNAWSTE